MIDDEEEEKEEGGGRGGGGEEEEEEAVFSIFNIKLQYICYTRIERKIKISIKSTYNK